MIAKQNQTSTDVDASKLIGQFDSTDDAERFKSRLQVVQLGHAAVPDLIKALSNPNKQIRWESALALKEIADPAAAPALVEALKDENLDVRGTAADALIALNRGAVIPILQALVKDFGSVHIRQGAHHVLHVLQTRGYLSSPEQKVFKALEDIAPEIEAPWAAEAALEALRDYGHPDAH